MKDFPLHKVEGDKEEEQEEAFGGEREEIIVSEPQELEDTKLLEVAFVEDEDAEETQEETHEETHADAELFINRTPPNTKHHHFTLHTSALRLASHTRLWNLAHNFWSPVSNQKLYMFSLVLPVIAPLWRIKARQHGLSVT